MINSQDLKFIGDNSAVVQSSAEVIVGSLQPYFVGNAVNRVKRLMIRFRLKGGQLGTVRPSMNSDVIDVFSTPQVQKQVIDKLRVDLGFEVEYVEAPYEFYLIKWDVTEKEETVKHINKDQNFLIAQAGMRYVCDTSEGGFTIRLPSNVVNKDFVVVSDQKGTWNADNLIVDGNGQRIFNEVSVKLDINHISVKFVYISHQNKWVWDM